MVLARRSRGRIQTHVVHDEDLDTATRSGTSQTVVEDATKSFNSRNTVQDSSTLLTMSVIEKEVSLISFFEKLTVSGVERESCNAERHHW